MKLLDTKHKSDEELQGETCQTALFHTVRLGANSEILFNERSPLSVLSPSECHLSGTDADLPDCASTMSQSEREALLADLKKENDALTKLESKTNLETWLAGIIRQARSAAMENGSESDNEENNDSVRVMEM